MNHIFELKLNEEMTDDSSFVLFIMGKEILIPIMFNEWTGNLGRSVCANCSWQLGSFQNISGRSPTYVKAECIGTIANTNIGPITSDITNLKTKSGNPAKIEINVIQEGCPDEEIPPTEEN